MIEGMKAVGGYRWHDKYTCAATDDVTRKGPKAREGQIVELTQFSVVDYTTHNKQLLLGFEDENGDVHYFACDKKSNVYEVQLEGKVYLLPGERPIGKVLSPGSSDVLYFSAHGVRYERPGGE